MQLGLRGVPGASPEGEGRAESRAKCAAKDA
jgi:hypothetical protein